MPETPEGPEYYTPDALAAPPPVPPPPSIADAAANYGSYGAPAAPQPSASQGLAVTALVLGLVAFFTGLIPVWGIVVGVTAVALGAVALGKRQSKGMSITGIVTGALASLVSIGTLVYVISGVNWASDPDNWFSYSPTTDDYISENSTTLGAEPVASGIAVAEQAFGKTSWDDTVWWYVVILENSATTTYPSTDVTIQALDGSGAVIDESWNYVSMPSGETAISGMFYELGSQQITSLAVVGPGEAASEEAPSGTLEVGPLTTSTDEWSSVVTGSVTSTFAEPLYAPSITIVVRDLTGTIIGAATTWVETLEAGSTETFEAYFYEPLPEGTTYTAYWATY